ncbi:DUF4158 domain-containing protein [Cardinium endosymbiont of Oedothorax gibbosus]|uniref:DUF4158 domain-containing protein n=1 Tax=Cardinium endosymbiont of Oedothorax gibbosus TaxID=931101 RepID=UPI002025764A|nr:DUF4158 domain-containing protein [Cardinium endosymbiont of Oedothorax gibbosus]
MYDWQDKSEWKDVWLLTPGQISLLTSMTDKGRFGFSVQLKFMKVYGKFPGSVEDISSDVIEYFSQQLGVPDNIFSLYEPTDRQGQRHRQAICRLLGYRPSSDTELRKLFN